MSAWPFFGASSGGVGVPIGRPARKKWEKGASNDNRAAIMLYAGGELNSASAWYLIPATSIDVTISDAGYATVNYPFAVKVIDGVTAYIGTASAQEGIFNLKEIENGIIPANTPVVL